MFQSQGRFFFGDYATMCKFTPFSSAVSIAGAILFWGLPETAVVRVAAKQFQSQGRFFFGGYHTHHRQTDGQTCFNRRGDSFLGATRRDSICDDNLLVVSIAGAILFWGLPSPIPTPQSARRCFNRRGDSFLGATW